MSRVFRLLVIAFAVAAMGGCAPTKDTPKKAGAEHQSTAPAAAPAKSPAKPPEEDEAEKGSHY